MKMYYDHLDFNYEPLLLLYIDSVLFYTLVI